MFQSLRSSSGGHSLQIQPKITKVVTLLKFNGNWIQFYSPVINMSLVVNITYNYN
jgi:hypothetical protein